MHPEVLAIMRNLEINSSARVLLGYVYGHTNGTLVATLAVDQVLEDLGISEGSLRRSRKDLEGWMRSRQRGDVLECEIEPWAVERGRHERADLREEDGDDAQTCANDGAQICAKRADLRETAGWERADLREISGNSKRAKREREGVQPPCTPHKELFKYDGEVNSSSPSLGGAGGDRTAALLTHLGLSPKQITEVSGKLDFAAVVAHIARWQMAGTRGEMYGIGALMTRFREWPVPALPGAESLQAGVLADYVSDEDLDDWGVKRPYDISRGYDVPKGYEDLVSW